MENKDINWEKISVYLAITVSLLTVIIYLFQIKDEISDIRERSAKLEVKVEKLEEK